METIGGILPVLIHEEEIFAGLSSPLPFNRKLLDAYRGASKTHLLVDEIYCRYVRLVWKNDDNAHRVLESYRGFMLSPLSSESEGKEPSEYLRDFSQSIQERLDTAPEDLNNTRAIPSDSEIRSFYVSKDDQLRFIKQENSYLRELAEELYLEVLLREI